MHSLCFIFTNSTHPCSLYHCFYSQKSEILSASPPNSGASICNWIKHLHSLPICCFEMVFPAVPLMLGSKPPFFPTYNVLLISNTKSAPLLVATHGCTWNIHHIQLVHNIRLILNKQLFLPLIEMHPWILFCFKINSLSATDTKLLLFLQPEHC